MDRPSFDDLYRDHFRVAWRAIRRRGVRRPEVIEELVHDTFIVVHRRMGEIDERMGSIQGWIHQIAAYTALNYLGRAHHH